MQNENFNFQDLLYHKKTNNLVDIDMQNDNKTNLDLVRRMQWLEEFPRGASLLTYLYRILLSVEADHTLNELLHTIFR